MLREGWELAGSPLMCSAQGLGRALRGRPAVSRACGTPGKRCAVRPALLAEGLQKVRGLTPRLTPHPTGAVHVQSAPSWGYPRAPAVLGKAGLLPSRTDWGRRALPPLWTRGWGTGHRARSPSRPVPPRRLPQPRRPLPEAGTAANSPRPRPLHRRDGSAPARGGVSAHSYSRPGRHFGSERGGNP